MKRLTQSKISKMSQPRQMTARNARRLEVKNANNNRKSDTKKENESTIRERDIESAGGTQIVNEENDSKKIV